MDNNIDLNSIKKVENSPVRNSDSVNYRPAVKNNSEEENKISELGKEFEKIFVKYLVDSMYKSVEMLSEDAGFERTIWQDFLNSELASKISESCDLGIAEGICRQYFLGHPESIAEDNDNIEAESGGNHEPAGDSREI